MTTPKNGSLRTGVRRSTVVTGVKLLGFWLPLLALDAALWLLNAKEWRVASSWQELRAESWAALMGEQNV